MENAEQQVQRKQRGSFGAGKPWKEPICRDAGRVLAWRFVNEAQGATEHSTDGGSGGEVLFAIFGSDGAPPRGPGGNRVRGGGGEMTSELEVAPSCSTEL